MSKIEWTDRTWNPVRGCSMAPGSEDGGCLNCYAARMAARGLPELKSPTTGKDFARRLPSGPRWTGDVELIEHKLLEPLRRPSWRGKRVFVNSMSDLFHKSLPDEVINRVCAVQALCPETTFQILTKRAERMREYWADFGKRATAIYEAAQQIKMPRGRPKPSGDFPLRNVWLGVSVENQQTADDRIPHLLATPAAVRFLSAEPLLGPIDLGLGSWIRLPRAVRSELPFPGAMAAPGTYRAIANRHGALSVQTADGGLLGVKPEEFERIGLDWVIAGGESGPDARPAHPDWIRSLRDQCASAGVPFFFKQWGEWTELTPASLLRGGDHRYGDWHGGEFVDSCLCTEGSKAMVRVGKRAAGRLLDGVEHSAFPEARR